MGLLEPALVWLLPQTFCRWHETNWLCSSQLWRQRFGEGRQRQWSTLDEAPAIDIVHFLLWNCSYKKLLRICTNPHNSTILRRNKLHFQTQTLVANLYSLLLIINKPLSNISHLNAFFVTGHVHILTFIVPRIPANTWINPLQEPAPICFEEIFVIGAREKTRQLAKTVVDSWPNCEVVFISECFQKFQHFNSGRMACLDL